MQHHHRHTTVTPSAHRSLCTEPVGIPTLLLQTPPASIPHLQAFRQPSDPPVKPPQIYYRAQRWIVIRKGGRIKKWKRKPKTLEMQEVSHPDSSPCPPTVPCHIFLSEESSSWSNFPPKCNAIAGSWLYLFVKFLLSRCLKYTVWNISNHSKEKKKKKERESSQNAVSVLKEDSTVLRLLHMSISA